MATPTITDLKSTFLHTQVLQLSAPLRISPRVLTRVTTGDDALRQRLIDDALSKLNEAIKKHNGLVYGPQASRHAAEQIDQSYWDAGEREVVVGNGGVEWVERGVDYRDDEVVSALPETWSEEASEQAPEQAARYEALQQRLVEASERRKSLKEKIAGYKEMHGLVGMFGEEGGVQENLVTRKGPVEEELDKMRLKMLRIERVLQGLPRREGVEDEDVYMDVEQDESLRAVLGS